MINDEITYEAIDLLETLISIPSLSKHEQASADELEAFITRKGYYAHRKGNNVWCMGHDFSPQKPTVLLNSHIDTVKANVGWSYDPFKATRDGERIYGLGANDAGASLVSLLAAFLIIDKKPQKYNIIYLASCEEEIGGAEGLQAALPLLPEISVAIVGEPTDMQPAVAEKGLMVLDGVIKGVAGHAARDEGVNAIYNAIEVIEKLRNIKFEKTSDTLGAVKITVTQIESGTQHNVVPDICKIVVDVRTIDCYSNVETLEYIKKNIPACEFNARSTRLNPSGINIKNPLIQRMLTLGCTPFGSPTLSDQALMPFDSVKIGPGSSSRSHTPDEYIEIPEIRQAINMYVAILDGLNL